MSKESDRLEDRGEKPDSVEGAQDQGVRKRSPDGADLPQAGPPRLVLVEELMEAAKGVSNMALAHEIVVNQAFQLQPSDFPEGSLEKRVKDIMHKAFWDILEAQLGEDPPSYDHAIKLLAEVKETLLSFLHPGQGHLRTRIQDALDLPLIQQQAENGALDMGRLACFIVGTMGSLCAPCRDQDIRTLQETTELVPLLKAIFSVLDLMKVDMANFALSSIRPQLMQQSVEYERNKFQEFLEKQPNALDFTAKWLHNTKACLSERSPDAPGSACASPAPPGPLSIHNHAYLRLLRWDHASDPFPETVLMDQARFQDLQQALEEVVLEASVLLVVYAGVGEPISGIPGLMDTLKSTIRAMLTGMHMPSFNVEEALATTGERLGVTLCHCLTQHGCPPLSADRLSTLKGQIVATAKPDNTVRKLMESRVESYLLASLESSQHKTPPPLPGGLAPVSKELRELAIRFGCLVNFNKLVFSPFYQRILQDMQTEREGEERET